jgi:hypothetical protein
MAENKKSFILYADLISVVRKLPKEKAGELFMQILSYVNDENPTIEDDLLLEVVFEPIKLQLKRDLKRWDEFRQKQSENGSKGGRPQKPKPLKENPKNPSLLDESQKSLNVTVNATVNVNAIDNVFKEYLLMRKRIKKPATDYAIELVKKKLDKIAGNNELLKIDILQQSITNSWSDVYPIKTNGTFNGQNQEPQKSMYSSALDK